MRRSSSDDHLICQKVIKSNLNKEIEISFNDYASNANLDSPQKNLSSCEIPTCQIAISSANPLDEIIQFSSHEQNKLAFLLNPDKWAQRLYANWEQIKPKLTPLSLTNQEELRQSMLRDFNDFLGSYLPRLKSEELYLKILTLIDELQVNHEDVKIFLIHQFRIEMKETRQIIEKYEIELSETQLLECLFRPFSAKSLKNEYDYLILKIKDYSLYTIFNQKFVSVYLDNKIKDFTNRCFFSNIEKLFGKLDEISQKYKDLFYLLIIKVLPKMSDKQQKNLNKLMSKNNEIPEGVKNFLKKQMKLIKEQEFETLKEHYNKLIAMYRQYDTKLHPEANQKIPTEKIKDFCTSLSYVIPIVKSNQSFCLDLASSMQGWTYTEYNWVKMLLSLPKISKLPKANLEQIKQTFKHVKDLCNPEMKRSIVSLMEEFIDQWGLKKNPDWTKLIN
jgi:hypothetical protein